MPALHVRSEPKKVRIDFAAPRDASTIVHSHIPPQSARLPHDGMRDVGPMGGGNRVLVLRQLDAGTRGDAVIRRISEEIAKLLSRVGEEATAAHAINRVVPIFDRAGGQSWGICFVELATSEVSS
jgi:RNA-binding protein 5/10